jgi:nucleotide-binding universal stress UspA family protein
MNIDRQRTFVVGVDATEEGGRALDWTRAAAGAHDSIVAVHAWDLPMMVGLDTAAVVPVVDMGEIAERGLAELLERLDDARIEPMTPQGHAGRALVNVAEDRDADVVVAGHQGSGRASIVLGSTANHVIHHTERPVVIVRGDHAPAPQLIVVGAADHDLDDDGVNESVRALRFAADQWPAARIDVVHAWFVPSVVAGRFSNPGGDFEDLDAEAVDVAQRVIDAAALDPSIDVRPRPVNGTAEFALIEESLDADLVVVGSHGRGGFAGLLLGSTSLDLASHSHSPVAIVR